MNETIILWSQFTTGEIITISLIIIWTFIWKGISLWKSARLSHKKWFVALLILNTVGILDIIYIYFIANKYTVETIDEDETKEVEEGVDDNTEKEGNKD